MGVGLLLSLYLPTLSADTVADLTWRTLPTSPAENSGITVPIADLTFQSEFGHISHNVTTNMSMSMHSPACS